MGGDIALSTGFLPTIDLCPKTILDWKVNPSLSVFFLSFRYSLDLSLQPLLHNQTVNMTCVFYIYMHSSYFLKVFAFFGTRLR